jgi:hypothetical protein
MHRLASHLSFLVSIALAVSFLACGDSGNGGSQDAHAGADLTGSGASEAGRKDGIAIAVEGGFPDLVAAGPDGGNDVAEKVDALASVPDLRVADGQPEGGSAATGTGGTAGTIDAGGTFDAQGADAAVETADAVDAQGAGGALGPAGLGSGGAAAAGGASGTGGLLLGTGGSHGNGGTVVVPAGTGGAGTGGGVVGVGGSASGGSVGVGGDTSSGGTGSGGTSNASGTGGTSAPGSTGGAAGLGGTSAAGSGGSTQAGGASGGAGGETILDGGVDGGVDGGMVETGGGATDSPLTSDDTALADASVDATPMPIDAGLCTGTIEALSLGITDGSIETAPTTLALGTDFTIEAWIYPTVASATGLIFTKWTDSAEDKTLQLANGLVSLRVWRGSDYALLTSTTSIGPGGWHHIACSVGGGSGRIFVDGVLDVEVPITAAPSADSTSPIWIGSMLRDGAQQPGLPGYISDLRVSSTARYTSAFSPALLLSPDADTLALWHIDDGGTSTTVRDSGPQSLDGTIEGTASWLAAPARCSAVAGD